LPEGARGGHLSPNGTLREMLPIQERDIESVLDEKVRPLLRAHNGDIELMIIEAGDVIRLRLAGACVACIGAEQTIRESFLSVGGVLVESGVSEELVAEALHFLKRGKCSGGPRSPKF
jgi:hypothetical protein